MIVIAQLPVPHKKDFQQNQDSNTRYNNGNILSHRRIWTLFYAKYYCVMCFWYYIVDHFHSESDWDTTGSSLYTKEQSLKKPIFLKTTTNYGK